MTLPSQRDLFDIPEEVAYLNALTCRPNSAPLGKPESGR